MSARAGVSTKGGAERKARQRGHALKPWVEAAFLRDGAKAQCRRCGRQVVVADGQAHGDALTVTCGEVRGLRLV